MGGVSLVSFQGYGGVDLGQPSRAVYADARLVARWDGTNHSGGRHQLVDLGLAARIGRTLGREGPARRW